MITSPNSKLSPSRLARKAIVYLRQSTERQVTHNLESQRLQYGLAERAKALGWEHIEVIDADLGCSAAVGAAERPGFSRMLAAITMGEVGIVLSRELSRLSRTDKDWCHLLELCQLFDTLIADAEQVYDLGCMDDQLILGIKGTMNAVELKILRMRMQQGLEAKARRGELLAVLPPGFVLDGTGKAIKDPDKRVREGMELVFTKFTEIGSCIGVFKWFRHQQIALPVSKPKAGKYRVVWQLPTMSFINHALRNPFYAGVYCYGRRPTETVLQEGQLRKRRASPRAAEQSKVFIRDHHEAYIDWAQFEQNQKTIERNAGSIKRKSGFGPWRKGSAVLSGMLRCGRCGRRFEVRYPRGAGTPGYYRCRGELGHGGDACLVVTATPLDARIEQEVLSALSPLAVGASLEAIDRSRSQRNDEQTALMRQAEELKYQARRAFEQYNEVDPRHRLVAEDLERRWNEKLQQVAETEARIKQCEQRNQALNAEERARLLALGSDFANVWNNPACPRELKKQIVRVLIEEIIIESAGPSADLDIVVRWAGGTHTRFSLARPKSRAGLPNDVGDIELIRRMAPRYGDAEIARVLSLHGRQTGKHRPWTARSVATTRSTHEIDGHKRGRRDPDILSLAQAALFCQVSNTSIKRLVREKILPMQQLVAKAPWEIRKSDLQAQPVQDALARLRRAGKLGLEGTKSNEQIQLL